MHTGNEKGNISAHRLGRSTQGYSPKLMADDVKLHHCLIELEAKGLGGRDAAVTTLAAFLDHLPVMIPCERKPASRHKHCDSALSWQHRDEVGQIIELSA